MTPVRIMITYNYMIELLPKRWQVASGLGYLIFECTTFIYATIFFHYNKDWTKFFCMAWIFNVVSFVFASVLPESPRFLQSVGREAELVASLEQMARWNCRKLKLGSGVAEDGSNLHQSLLATD